MSTPLTPTETIKLLDNAVKNNQDWFYDSPDKQSAIESTYRFAGKYFELASKWTLLNKAATEALKVIQNQQDELIKLENRVNTQDKLINRLNTEIVTLTNACKEIE
jgi:uncharacterized coiled-coil protein SlyX